MDSTYFNAPPPQSRSRVDSSFSSLSKADNHNNLRRKSSPSGRQSISFASYSSLLPEQAQNYSSVTRPATSNNDSRSHSTSFPTKHILPPPNIQGSVHTTTKEGQRPDLPPLSNTFTQASIVAHAPVRNSVKEDPPKSLPNMASIGYLPSSQFGGMSFHDPTYDPHYQSLDSHSSGSHSNNFQSLFGHGSFPAQSLYTAQSLSLEPSLSSAAIEPALTHISDSMSHLNRGTSPFQQPVYESMEYSGPHSSRSISHSPMSSHQLPVESISPGLSNGMDRSSSFFESMNYPGSYASTTILPTNGMFQDNHGFSYGPPPQNLTSSNISHSLPTRTASESQARVINQKPKPQCWDHGCNGREFSTFSNLLRHQREKSGTAAKSYCPKCGAEFTRTTARNGHLAHEKCSKQRRSSSVKEEN